MNEDFTECTFVGCNNLVARSRKAIFCYAVHILLDGMDSPTDWRAFFMETVRERVRKTVVFAGPLERNPKDDDDFMAGLATEVCADWHVYYIGDPSDRDGHYRALYAAKESAKRDPEKTIIIFETSDLTHDDNVANLRSYYDYLERFPEAHICSSLLEGTWHLRDL